MATAVASKTNGKSSSPVVRGEIEQLNENGVKVNGAWFNYSKWGQVDEHAAGDTVQLELDGSGRFIKRLEAADPFALSMGQSLQGTSGGKLPEPPAEKTTRRIDSMLLCNTVNAAVELVNAGTLPVDRLTEMASAILAWHVDHLEVAL